ncbi:MAG: response regulator [Nitrospira sp.]
MNGYGKRVLIADDEECVRRLIGLLLAREGFTVHEAGDGIEALAELKKWRFDGLMADCSLPRLDGVQLLLLSRMMWPEIPVLLLSADLHELPEPLKRQGASALVPKPFDPHNLLQALHEAISLAYAEHSAGHMTSEAS